MRTVDSSSAWHFLTEEKIPRSGNGSSGGDEIGLDAAYLVSVIVEQALKVYGAARKKDADHKKQSACFATATDAEKKAAKGGGGRCLEGRRRQSQATNTDGPEAVCRMLCDVYTDATSANISGDADLVRFVLGRLHAATAAPAEWRVSRCRRRRGGLGPPLLLFLRQLYDVSHKTCWHLDEWQRRRDRDELRSLGAFARLLCRNAVQPTEALLDAINKGMNARIQNNYNPTIRIKLVSKSLLLTVRRLKKHKLYNS